MFIVLLISLSVFSVISIYNLFSAPVLKKTSERSTPQKFVSVLIPARNEEMNIEKCIKGILAQDYKDKEIIVLDDNSTDSTYNLVSSFSTSDVKVLKGKQFLTDSCKIGCHHLHKKLKVNIYFF
jgi:chlorobactene glucosyltransferase